jgi:hypothetical protein
MPVPLPSVGPPSPLWGRAIAYDFVGAIWFQSGWRSGADGGGIKSGSGGTTERRCTAHPSFATDLPVELRYPPR